MAEVDTVVDRDPRGSGSGLSRLHRLAWPLGVVGLIFPVASATLVFMDRSAIHSVAAASPPGIIVPIGFAVIGALLASRLPGNKIGWIFLGIAVLGGIEGFAHAYVFRSLHFHQLPFAVWVAWLDSWVLWLLFPSGLVVFLFLLFPDGHFQSRRWRRFGWVAASFATAGVFLNMVQPTLNVKASRAIPNPLAVKALNGLSNYNSFSWAVLFLGGIVTLVAAMVGTVIRTRRSTGELRQQLRWLGYAAGVTAVGLVADFVLSILVPDLPNGWFTLVIVLGLGVAVPVSCGVAILKHGLYDLDVVVSKTVVYGLLAAFFTVVYLAVVVGIETAIGSAHNPILTLLAAAVIAFAFDPVRRRAKRFANRLVYGERATPYEVLSGFTERMAGTFSIEDVLPRTARTLAQGTGAIRADVWLRVGTELRAEGSWPSPPVKERVALEDERSIDIAGASRVVPVRHQDGLLGALSIQKAPGDPLAPTEEKLLDDVAAQAGLVLRNVGLIEELRASRQRLVVAQDQERRRIERNIHDGAQQELVALAVKLNLVDSLVGRDEAKERSLLAELKAEATGALENLRDLARGIYPPLLADKGLAAALDGQVRKAAVPVSLQADGIGRWPPEIEAAVYFCCLEALQNIAKYANATMATVRLSNGSGTLTFEVTDDGRGFDQASTGYGTGLQGMADRLDALGGELEVRSSPDNGTTITGRVTSLATRK
jgi:signal transduction histidine kinase